jgi:hypothetical protein
VSTHEFTLVLTGFQSLSEDVEDALFEAGCDDALLGIRSGVPYLEFEREAPSLIEAVLSAIRDVNRSGVARVTSVEPEDLVTATEIARRTGRTRESIRLLVEGERGPGAFPAPLNPTAKTRLWRWSAVEAWMSAYECESGRNRPAHEPGNVFAAVNGALEIRKNAPPEVAHRIIDEILPKTAEVFASTNIVLVPVVPKRGGYAVAAPRQYSPYGFAVPSGQRPPAAGDFAATDFLRQELLK